MINIYNVVVQEVNKILYSPAIQHQVMCTAVLKLSVDLVNE